MAASGDQDEIVALTRFASVSGIVVMPDGAPAVGADVQLLGPDIGWSVTETDAGGRFELEEADPRSRTVCADIGEVLRASQEIQLAEGGAASDLRLTLMPREHSYVRVRVLDGKGLGVRGARVTDERTDEDGAATLALLEPLGTEVWLTAEAAGFLDTPFAAHTFWSPDLAPVLDVVLREGVLVRLDARTADGTPLEDASAELAGAEGRCGDAERWQLDPEAEYTVWVRAPGFITSKLEGWVPPPGGGVLAVTLRPCAAVRWRVVDSAGAPVTEVYATIEGTIDYGYPDEIECDTDGSYLLGGLGEGHGILVLGRRYSDLEAAAEISTASGQVTDVGTLTLVPEATVTGRVVDSASRPLGGATVGIDTSLPDLYERAFSHADGTFRIRVPGFAPGSLIVRKRGYGTVRTEFAPGPARFLGAIALPTPGSVDVEVETIDGEEASVVLAWPGSASVARGAGRKEDLAPGRYIARLERGGATIEQEVVVVAGETTKVTFRLER